MSTPLNESCVLVDRLIKNFRRKKIFPDLCFWPLSELNGQFHPISAIFRLAEPSGSTSSKAVNDPFQKLEMRHG